VKPEPVLSLKKAPGKLLDSHAPGCQYSETVFTTDSGNLSVAGRVVVLVAAGGGSLMEGGEDGRVDGGLPVYVDD
jgi:hypothetical protein